MPSPAKPVTIRGVTYESIHAAAREIGVSYSTIQNAIKRSTLDYAGLGYREYGNNAKSVRIRGVTYPSQVIAAQVLGIKQSGINRAIRRGTLNKVGLGLFGRPRKDE
jgi:hypothetical protein